MEPKTDFEIKLIKKRTEFKGIIMKNRFIAESGIGLLVWFSFLPFVSAQIWTQTSAPTNRWSAVAVSADGKRVVAAAGNPVVFANARKESIYVSSDSGQSWVQTDAPSNYWTSVACSADGLKLVAAAGYPGPSGAPLFTSTNGGVSWVSNNLAPLNWRSVACSADGSKLYAVTSYGDLSISTNSGLNWITTSAPNTAWVIGSSALGDKLVAAPGHLAGRICTSIDFGATWITNVSPNSVYLSVASSADGTKLMAVDGIGGPIGRIYTSTDSGATWTSNGVPLLFWKSAALSSDGTKMIAAGSYSSGEPLGSIFTSSDAGATWASNNVSRQAWSAVACSADGSVLVAVSAADESRTFGKGRIWISRTNSSPVVTIASRSNAMVLSWVVPSANFVLQQTSDPTFAEWKNVVEIPVLNLANLENEVLVPASSGPVFYRLKMQ